MRKPKFNDDEIIEILKKAKSGLTRTELCSEYGMSSSTFYRWRARYVDLDTPLRPQIKQLEADNSRLKMLYEIERLKLEIIQLVLSKKW
nr:transposase [Acinetobacter tandoii]